MVKGSVLATALQAATTAAERGVSHHCCHTLTVISKRTACATLVRLSVVECRAEQLSNRAKRRLSLALFGLFDQPRSMIAVRKVAEVGLPCFRD